MKSIKPTPHQKVLKELFDYNPETGQLFYAKTTGRRAKQGTEAGFIEKCGYRRITIKKEKFVAHRIVWKWMTGEDPSYGMVIDHINEQPSDNRWENLRLLPNHENVHRTPRGSNGGVRRPNSTWKPKETKSGELYVYWHAERWCVWIPKSKGGNSKSFTSLEAAVAWRDEQLIQVYAPTP